MKTKKLTRLALLGANFFAVFGWTLLMPLYALYVSDLGGNAQTAALTWSFYTLLAGVLILVLGWVEDRLQHKERALLLGYILQTCGALLLFLANDLTMLWLGYGVYAVGTGFVVPAWKLAFSRIKMAHKEAANWGIFDGGNMLLISAAAAASGIVYGFAGFRGVLGLMVAAHVVSVIIGIRLVIRRV